MKRVVGGASAESYSDNEPLWTAFNPRAHGICPL